MKTKRKRIKTKVFSTNYKEVEEIMTAPIDDSDFVTYKRGKNTNKNV